MNFLEFDFGQNSQSANYFYRGSFGFLEEFDLNEHVYPRFPSNQESDGEAIIKASLAIENYCFDQSVTSTNVVPLVLCKLDFFGSIWGQPETVLNPKNST